MKIPLQKQIGQLADCKAATHKKQHSAIRRKLPHQDDPGRQRAEHFCLLFRQKQGENGQRQWQMQRPGGIQRPEGHFGRADRPHLHQDRKPLYTQCRTAEGAGPIARAGSKIAPGTDFQKHRAGRAHGRGQPASGRRAQSRRVSGRSAWTAPECHPGAAAAFPAVSGAAIAFFRFGLSCSVGKAEPHRGNWP